MLEVAILNASKENPTLAQACRVARDRRPARVELAVRDLSRTLWNNAANSYELWFSGGTLPRACQPDAGS
jgi:hypothetical protein